jgi:asparagine synthase (glutamine-hydrolysing)
MPGLSILEGWTADINCDDSELFKNSIVNSALRSIKYDNNYSQEFLLKEGSFAVICTKYKEYPVTVFENDKFWVCVEGKIYGKEPSMVKSDVYTLLSNSFFSDGANQNSMNLNIRSWLSMTDGEFVIYALNKKNKEFVIINDILGRLPIYIYDVGSKVIISRDISLLAYIISYNYNKDNNNTENECILDKKAITQYILFGYTLDKRTLLKDIFRMSPGCVTRLRIDKNSISKIRKLEIDNVFSFNFEKKPHYNDTLKENSERIVSLFTKACRDRANHDCYNIISLSGGFDSRLVAAFFHHNKIPCRCITYKDHGWRPLFGNKSEAEIANRIARTFNFDWKNYDSFQASSVDFLKLLDTKLGSVHLGYSFMLPILEDLKKKYTSGAVLITGYGGGGIFPNWIPAKKNKDLHELVDYIIHRESYLSLNEISQLMQIDKEEIIADLKEVLMHYPERSMDQKYVHFILYGLSIKEISEVEDRDRHYFWSTSPYYSVPLFTYAMGCSDNNKSSGAFHRELLRLLSTSASAIESSDYGCSIMSYKFSIIIPLLKSLLFRYYSLRRLAALILRKRDHDTIDTKMIQFIEEDIKKSKNIHIYFSIEKLMEILKDPSRYGMHIVYRLFTIVSLIEKTNGKIFSSSMM